MNQVYLINAQTFAGYEDLSANIKPSRIAVFVKKAQDLDLKPFLGTAFYYDLLKYLTNPDQSTASITVANTTAADGVYINVDIFASTGAGKTGKATITVAGGIVTTIAESTMWSGYTAGDKFICKSVPGASFTITQLSDELILSDDIPDAYRDLIMGCDYTDTQGHDIYYEGLLPTLVYFTFARFIEADSIHYTATGPVIKDHDSSQPVSDKTIARLVAMQRSTANAHANDVEKFLRDNKSSFPLWRFNAKNKNSRQPGPRLRGVDKTGYNRGGFGIGYNDGFGFNGI